MGWEDKTAFSPKVGNDWLDLAFVIIWNQWDKLDFHLDTSGQRKRGPAGRVCHLVFWVPAFLWHELSPWETVGQPLWFMTKQFSELSVYWWNNQLELVCLLTSIKAADYSGDWPPSVSLAQEQTIFFCLHIFWVPSTWLKIVPIRGKIRGIFFFNSKVKENTLLTV